MRRWLISVLAVSMLCSCAGGGVPSLLNTQAVNEAGGVRPATVPIVGGCRIFAAINCGNTYLSAYPLDKLSSKYIAALPRNRHPDFGHKPDYGIPFNIV